jgi:hypothetical protein
VERGRGAQGPECNGQEQRQKKKHKVPLKKKKKTEEIRRERERENGGTRGAHRLVCGCRLATVSWVLLAKKHSSKLFRLFGAVTIAQCKSTFFTHNAHAIMHPQNTHLFWEKFWLGRGEVKTRAKSSPTANPPPPKCYLARQATDGPR